VTDNGLPFGRENPAPGTMLWRLRFHPDTLEHADAIRLAMSLDGQLTTAQRPPTKHVLHECPEHGHLYTEDDLHEMDSPVVEVTVNDQNAVVVHPRDPLTAPVPRGPVREYRKTATVMAGQAPTGGTIPTLEGDHTYEAGDYIAGPGQAGEFWPVKRAIFEATYEPLDATPSSAPVDPNFPDKALTEKVEDEFH
jgi:hypothetical protein